MSSNDIFKDARKEYTKDALDEGSVAVSPFEQFSRWFSEAAASGQIEPNACALATVSADAQPSVRMVLLKMFDERGFVFFTNYGSKKGEHLARNDRAALLFYWPHLERQIRIEGKSQKISDSESDEYFYSRPRGAQLGAAVSQQSQRVESRLVIDDTYERFKQSLGEGRIERPVAWGGYRVVPHEFEFWQGRESRLHDRIRYTASSQGWERSRLWP